MDVRSIILKKLNERGEVTTAEVTKEAGFSRVYVNKFLNELKDEGKIVLIGRTNRAKYVLANKDIVAKAKHEILGIHRFLQNIDLSEDVVLDEIKRDTGVFIDLSQNVNQIVSYAFTEILNNAIEHSKSSEIEVVLRRDESMIRFDIIDRGIGIYNNLMQTRGLKGELEAIQDLLKGKQTTAPEAHTGEGIFFTSKVSDTMTIQSSNKKLIFNNIIEDIFIRDVKNFKGTKVTFSIASDSRKVLEDIFKKYTGDSYEFSKTSVAVRLYKMGTLYISRSQAKRIMTGLEKFRTISLDFKHIKMVGQAFADEIFRIWKSHHPDIEIRTTNTNENIDFMIKRAMPKPEEHIGNRPQLFK